MAVILMIFVRQLMRSPEFRRAFPEKEAVATALADHVAGAKDEEVLMNAMDITVSVCFSNKAPQIAFERARGVAALLKHVAASAASGVASAAVAASSSRVAGLALRALGAVLTDNSKVQGQCAPHVFPLLCPLIRDERTPTPTLVAATTTLGLSCDTEPSAKRRLVQEAMIEVLVGLVERRNDELREAGLSALRCFARTTRLPVLTTGVSEWRTMVRQHGALQPMAALIGAAHVGTRTQAVGALHESIKDHKENTKLVYDIVLQHAPVLVASLTTGADPNLQYYTLGVLCSLCYKKSNLRSFAAVPGLKDRVFALTASDNEVVRGAANYTARIFL